ncbi:MAG: hypothetical protein J6Z36_03190 [Clostridia bacterium]|nr:hypothetical protein [Clostridia bacterium]
MQQEEYQQETHSYKADGRAYTITPKTSRRTRVIFIIATAFFFLLGIFFLVVDGTYSFNERAFAAGALFFLAVLSAIIGLFPLELLKEKYVFTPLYFCVVKNGKEGDKIYWELVDNICLEKGVTPLSAMTSAIIDAYTLHISYAAYGKAEEGEESVFVQREMLVVCTKKQLEKIAEIIPIYWNCTYSSKREEELLTQDKKRGEYLKSIFYDFSIRIRVCYLIACLERALIAYNAVSEEWKERLCVLWNYAAFRATESEREEWKESLKKYVSEEEAFPEFAPTDLENMHTLGEWLNTVKTMLDELPRKSEQDKVIYEIVRSIYSVGYHTPENDDYLFENFHASDSLDTIAAVRELLTSNGIDEPVSGDFTSANVPYAVLLFDLNSENTRDPSYGIGLPFNGRKLFSCLVADREEKPIQDVYRFINEAVLAPEIEEQEDIIDDEGYLKHVNPTSGRKIKLITAREIFGAVFALLGVLGAFLYAVSTDHNLQVAATIIGGLCGIFGIIYLQLVLGAKRVFSEYHIYETKWIDAFVSAVFFGLYLACAIWIYEKTDEVPSPLWVIYLLFGTAISAGQTVLIVCTSRYGMKKVRWEKVVTDGDTWWKQHLPAPRAGKVSAAILAVGTIVFAVLFHFVAHNFALYALAIICGIAEIMVGRKITAINKLRILKPAEKTLLIWAGVFLILFAIAEGIFVLQLLNSYSSWQIATLEVFLLLIFAAKAIAWIVYTVKTAKSK